ncbi:intermembrane lipid transfer protein VPS13A-like [Lampetra fluviatilis]
MASSTLDGIKRVAESVEEVVRVRPPRVIHPDGLVRPYCLRESTGNQVLQRVSGGRYGASDDYCSHVALAPNMKKFLLVTTRRVMYITKDLLDQYNTEWEHQHGAVKSTTRSHNIITITLKEARRVGVNLRSHETVTLHSDHAAQWVLDKISEARAAWDADSVREMSTTGFRTA